MEWSEKNLPHLRRVEMEPFNHFHAAPSSGERTRKSERSDDPGWGALKKRTRAQDDFASAVSRRACLDAIFLQIKVAGKLHH
jgi:hypothetical protein